MGAGQSDLYKGTYGDKAENIPDELAGKVKLPENDSQLKHIFRKAEGHLEDTPENRELLENLANDIKYHAGKDQYGNDWNFRNNDNGAQDWVRSRNDTINDGGRNSTPRTWDPDTGLNFNPWGSNDE